jgi:hypothetical protein
VTGVPVPPLGATVTALDCVAPPNVAVGVIISLVVLGPKRYGGLQLGAVGLAIKMVTLQFLSVNLQLFVHCRYLKVPFIKTAARQIRTIFLFLGVGIGATWGASWGWPMADDLIKFVISGLVYCSLVLGLLLASPTLLGLTPSDLSAAWVSAINALRIKSPFHDSPHP